MTYPSITRALAALTFTAFIGLPLIASAQTNDIASQVQSLLSQIQALQEQLRTLVVSQATSSTWNWNWPGATTTPSVTGTTTPPFCATFPRDLKQGDSGSDVTDLQQLLKEDGFFSASSTGTFGPLTANALAKFQQHFNVASSTGFFGPLTRSFLIKRCGEAGGEGAHATSTPPMGDANWWDNASGSIPWIPGTTTFPGPSANTIWGSGATTSTTTRPCNDRPGILILHSIIPGMFSSGCRQQE